MRVDKSLLKHRNAELGHILYKARTGLNLTQQQCADYLGTSRQRYGQIEIGTVPILVPEYEAMLRFLKVPFSEVWYDPLAVVVPTHDVVVSLPETLGVEEILHIVVRIGTEE